MYFLLQIAVAKQVPYSTYHEEIRNNEAQTEKTFAFKHATETVHWVQFQELEHKLKTTTNPTLAS